MEAIEAQKAAELVKKREAAERRAREAAERKAKEQEKNRVMYTQDSLTRIKVEGPPKYYVGEYLRF